MEKVKECLQHPSCDINWRNPDSVSLEKRFNADPLLPFGGETCLMVAAVHGQLQILQVTKGEVNAMWSSEVNFATTVQFEFSSKRYGFCPVYPNFVRHLGH